MTGITVVNPSQATEGTDYDDSFTVTVEAPLDLTTLDGKGGYDTLVADRSFAANSDIRVWDNGGSFHADIGNGYNYRWIADNFENVQITGSPGSDSMRLTIGPTSSSLSVSFDGGAGSDALEFDFSAADFGLAFDASGPTITSSYGSFAGFEAFNITGGAGDDTIRTGDGNDRLSGGDGTNILDGGAGSDQITSSSIADQVDGGAGDDLLTLNYSSVVTDLTIDIGDSMLVNGATVATSVETVQGGGGSGDDTFTVSRPGYVAIDGGDGNDTLIGGVPVDQAQQVLVNTTTDGILQGYVTATGDNTLGYSGFENVDLVGGSQNDTFELIGIFGAHQIALDGGGGTDSLQADFSLLDGATTFMAHADGTVNSNRGTFANFESFNFTGGAGDDTITTLGGPDFVDARAGTNIVRTAGGNDYLYTGHGNDTLDGGAGVDTLMFDPDGAALTVDLSDTASQDTGQGTDTITGIENVYGSMNDDVLSGNALANEIRAQYGDDLLAGGSGDDLLDGGQGNDVASYASATQGVTVDATVATAQNTGQGSDTLIDIEGLIGSDYADHLTDGWNGYLDGRAGDDILIGSGGNDALEGGTGADMLFGGAGNDAFHVDTQADLVFETPGEGTDAVYSSASFYLYADIENLALDMGAGDLFGVGNGLNNIVVGNEGSNLLLGGAGDDTIYGVDGIDNLFGESGNDRLNGDAGIDYLVGGDGDDVLDGGGDADALYGEAGNDVLSGGAGFVTDILVAGDGSDTLYGNSGLGDYDRMNGGLGDDTYFVDTGDDLTFEAANGGTDTVYANVAGENNGIYLYANVENVVLLNTTTFGVGNELDNRLTGSNAPNWLLGGDGNDTIDGKSGNDVLFGEAGNDTFLFEHGTGGDVIGDFTHGEDQIDVSDFGFASFADLQSHFAQVDGDGAIYLGGADFIVLQNTAMAALDAGDFVL